MEPLQVYSKRLNIINLVFYLLIFNIIVFFFISSLVNRSLIFLRNSQLDIPKIFLLGNSKHSRAKF